MAVNLGKSEYGDVIISLENCILDENHLKNTPSIKDGLDKEVEIDLRIVGCEYIQVAGILLKLPQVSAFQILDVNFAFVWNFELSCFALEPSGSYGYSTSDISTVLLQ